MRALRFAHRTAAALARHVRGGRIADTPALLPRLAELDRLEAALAAVPDDDAARSRITHRLNA
ncbi:hypothetical protein VM98_37920, partial [Streptomyces rubellomurinus subsp. indigoferus]